MPAEQTKNPWYITAVLFVVFISLIFGGIRLINQSETQYEKSISYTERILNDSTLKQKNTMLPGYTLTKEGYTTALLYFTLAIGVVLLAVLLPRLQSINIGTSGLSLILKELPEKLDDIVKQNNAVQSTSAGEGGYKEKAMTEAPEKIKKNFEKQRLTGNYNDDPQKNKWGGKAYNKDRQLTADVVLSPIPGYYTVTLTVASTNQKSPLKGLVKFHLHNTFLNPDPVIAVDDNKAKLRLNRVYGAFTVGAEADEGATKLELDLAENKNFPEEFLKR